MSTTPTDPTVLANGKPVPPADLSVSAVRDALHYPPTLKRHYIELLKLYKTQLAVQRRRKVGWQTIRDLIMAPEDAALSALADADRSKRNAKKARGHQKERDSYFTLDNLLSWIKGPALPSNGRFFYIDRFIRNLRIDGQMDNIESIVSASRTEYLRESMAAFYRPDVHLHAENEDRASVALKWTTSIDSAIFVIQGGTNYSMSIEERKVITQNMDGPFLLFLFTGSCARYIVPATLIACFADESAKSAILRPPISVATHQNAEEIDQIQAAVLPDFRCLHLYSGFVVPHGMGIRPSIQSHHFGFKLRLVKSSHAHPFDEGVVLFSKPSLDLELELSINEKHRRIIITPESQAQLRHYGLAPHRHTREELQPGQKIYFSGVPESPIIKTIRDKFAMGYRSW